MPETGARPTTVLSAQCSVVTGQWTVLSVVSAAGVSWSVDRADYIGYGGGAGGSIGFSVRYQGELWGIWDLQNRDPRRKSPPETEKSVG